MGYRPRADSHVRGRRRDIVRDRTFALHACVAAFASPQRLPLFLWRAARVPVPPRRRGLVSTSCRTAQVGVPDSTRNRNRTEGLARRAGVDPAGLNNKTWSQMRFPAKRSVEG